MRQLWETLPRYLRIKWTERLSRIRSVKGQTASFNDFCQFVSEQANLARNPIYSEESISKPMNAVEKYHKQNDRKLREDMSIVFTLPESFLTWVWSKTCSHEFSSIVLKGLWKPQKSVRCQATCIYRTLILWFCYLFGLVLSTLPDNPRDSRFWAVSHGLQGRFPFSQNFRKFRLNRKWKMFRRFVRVENSRKKWKI